MSRAEKYQSRLGEFFSSADNARSTWDSIKVSSRARNASAREASAMRDNRPIIAESIPSLPPREGAPMNLPFVNPISRPLMEIHDIRRELRDPISEL